MVIKKVRTRLGIASAPKKDSPKKMSAMEELQYCAGTLSWRQRCAMKNEYVACLKERLPAVPIIPKCHLVCAHVRNFTYQLVLSSL
uniref:Uncharacterized protein n=1 Tax=Ditylenchus dipsaci TaxID=166011 RepID=A0A915CLQ2_9BILA